jgi:predicted FMN-binding regulatory protein PaiB
MQLQVAELEGDKWSMDEQPKSMIDNMLAHIRCFEISIDRIDKAFKVSK